MVDRNAAKWAVLLGGALLAVLVAGQVLRFVSRMLAFSALALLAVVAVYVVYEVVKGASDAGTTEPAGTDTVEDLKQQYASGDLSEPEFERELDEVMDEETDADPGVVGGQDTTERREPERNRQ